MFTASNTRVPTIQDLRIAQPWACQVYSFPNGIFDSSNGPTGWQPYQSDTLTLGGATVLGGQYVIDHPSGAGYTFRFILTSSDLSAPVTNVNNPSMNWILSIRATSDGSLIQEDAVENNSEYTFPAVSDPHYQVQNYEICLPE